MSQKIDPNQGLEFAYAGPPPLILRIQSRNHTRGIVEGVPAASARNEDYVRLSALPKDLRDRVVVAVNMLVGG